MHEMSMTGLPGPPSPPRHSDNHGSASHGVSAAPSQAAGKLTGVEQGAFYSDMDQTGKDLEPTAACDRWAELFDCITFYGDGARN